MVMLGCSARIMLLLPPSSCFPLPKDGFRINFPNAFFSVNFPALLVLGVPVEPLLDVTGFGGIFGGRFSWDCYWVQCAVLPLSHGSIPSTSNPFLDVRNMSRAWEIWAFSPNFENCVLVHSPVFVVSEAGRCLVFP